MLDPKIVEELAKKIQASVLPWPDGLPGNHYSAALCLVLANNIINACDADVEQQDWRIDWIVHYIQETLATNGKRPAVKTVKGTMQ